MGVCGPIPTAASASRSTKTVMAPDSFAKGNVSSFCVKSPQAAVWELSARTLPISSRIFSAFARPRHVSSTVIKGTLDHVLESKGSKIDTEFSRAKGPNSRCCQLKPTRSAPTPLSESVVTKPGGAWIILLLWMTEISISGEGRGTCRIHGIHPSADDVFHCNSTTENR